MKLSMIVLIVSDLANTKRFYRDLLGFSVVAEDERKLVFAHDGADFVAFLGARDAPSHEHGSDAASVFVFGVASLDDDLARLRAAGVHILHDAPAQNEWGRYGALRDPSGNIVELIERAR